MSPLAAMAAVLSLFTQDPRPEPPPAPSEAFDLDIAEKRIQRPGFAASAAACLEPAEGGVRVDVGASVSARVVDILLKNVHGTVRFRADTSRLQAMLARPAGSEPRSTVR